MGNRSASLQETCWHMGSLNKLCLLSLCLPLFFRDLPDLALSLLDSSACELCHLRPHNDFTSSARSQGEPQKAFSLLLFSV